MKTVETPERTEETVARGFVGVPCIKCGEPGNVSVSLENMTLYCTSCENEFTVGDVKEVIRAWQPVLAWIEQAPAIDF